MAMPGRTLSIAEGYRYGFNGKEMDNEVNGEGNKMDFGARIYDSRLGRWLSVDPMQPQYRSHSPYTYALGNPIFFIDPSGGSVEPSNITIIKERGTNKFKVTGDITIKLQIINLSVKKPIKKYISILMPLISKEH